MGHSVRVLLYSLGGISIFTTHGMALFVLIYMKPSVEIDPEILREMFSYNPETGMLTRRRTGKVVVGTNNGCGHLQVWVIDRLMYIHRVAFAIVNGRFPNLEIDHINGNPADNRIANLREASRSENSRNRRANRNSKTGIFGVFWHKNVGKYNVQIEANGKVTHIGYFNSLEDAYNARKEAEILHHGEFASQVSRCQSMPSNSKNAEGAK